MIILKILGLIFLAVVVIFFVGMIFALVSLKEEYDDEIIKRFYEERGYYPSSEDLESYLIENQPQNQF